tara:strand:+ start:425 stop:1114 length:690 start_codon:yes stop_codon:yes gene_type:complete
MKIDEVIQSLTEGPNDPHIFKAVFMAGGPGSGKSFVSEKLLSSTGLRTVNSDDIYEYMMGKENLPLDSETIFSPQGQEIRNKAKAITQRKHNSHIDGRLGLVIDGTGKDVARVKRSSEALRELGYEAMMIFVNTSLEVAQERNQQRQRSLDPATVEKMWNSVQQNIMSFQQLFGTGNFIVVDNSGGLEDPNRAENFRRVEKDLYRFLETPPKMPQAKEWIKSHLPDNKR